jgi:threonine dehydratase
MTVETMPEIPLSLADFKQAAQRASGVVRHTDLLASEVFSRQTNTELYLKLENLQRTGSFKFRGAYNKLSQLATLPLAERPRGIIAASAGNHAQGVASAGAVAGFPVTVVMPLGASLTKMRSCAEMGAEVIQHGSTLEDAALFAKNLATERGLLFVHPFDDPQIIAGQGTLGLELLEDLPDVETVLVPVGGGGLVSGIAMAIKLQKPSVRIIGVQTEAVAPYFGYIKSGQFRPNHPGAMTIADGIRVKSPGQLTAQIIRRYVDDIVTVDDSEISEAIVAVLERTRTVIEGAGAVGLAALLHNKISTHFGEKVIAVLSGGNIDITLIGRIIDFGLVSSGRYLVVAVIVPDTPGQLVHLLEVVARLGMNVRQVEHRRGELQVPVGQTEIVLQVETKDREQQKQLLAAFDKEEIKVRTLNS